MKDFLKIALVAGAAWWLLKDQFSFESPTAAPPPSSSSPGAAPAAPENSAPPPPAAETVPPKGQNLSDPFVLAASVPAMAHLAGDVKLTADQWNWYNAQGRGIQTTADLFTPSNRGELITAAEYWTRRLAAGLSGLRRRTEHWNRRRAADPSGLRRQAWVN